MFFGNRATLLSFVTKRVSFVSAAAAWRY